MSTSSIRLVVTQALVAFFLMSICILLLQSKGKFSLNDASHGTQIIEGVVLSMTPERFNRARHVLTPMGFRVAHKVPPSFESKEVNESMEAYVGSRELHNPTNLKAWSNQMAFVDLIQAFMVESQPKRWRFFFEDDIALHPNVTSEHAKVLIAKGMEIADEDGFVFLGICGPQCDDGPPMLLDGQVEAARCAGPCTHAFGLQSRSAAKFLQRRNEFHPSDAREGLYLDQFTREYARWMKNVWVLGSNLKSPAAGDHVGILFQDRHKFRSIWP